MIADDREMRSCYINMNIRNPKMSEESGYPMNSTRQRNANSQLAVTESQTVSRGGRSGRESSAKRVKNAFFGLRSETGVLDISAHSARSDLPSVRPGLSASTEIPGFGGKGSISVSYRAYSCKPLLESVAASISGAESGGSFASDPAFQPIEI